MNGGLNFEFCTSHDSSKVSVAETGGVPGRGAQIGGAADRSDELRTREASSGWLCSEAL
jgi:hypothetical protein